MNEGTAIPAGAQVGAAAMDDPRVRGAWRAAVVTGIISFLIYAAVALSIHRGQDKGFIPERSSLTAAASQMFYGAPFGAVYSGVLAAFFEKMDIPVDDILARAARKEIAPGQLLPTIMDGNGIGYITIAAVAFHLFGPHVVSTLYMVLLLLGISGGCFLYRFHDPRCAVVVLYFTAMTLLLFTPLAWLPANITNIPIGGIRYYAVVSILPAFHLILECLGTRGFGPRLTVPVLVPLAIQTAILVLAVLVRNSAGPAICAIGVACLIAAWRDRRNPAMFYGVLRRAAAMIVVGAVVIGILLTLVSREYVTRGRFTETVWHRIFVSLGLNDRWPFGNLRQVYDCTANIPAGLTNGPEDQNGHCVWLIYVKKNGISPEEYQYMTYGGRYDAALREAFFDIFRAYPYEVARTFVVYKPRYIVWSVIEGLKFDLALVPPWLFWLLAAALVNFLIAAATLGLSRAVSAIAGAIALFAAFGLIPYFLVWAMPHTSTDLTLYCLMGFGLLLMTLLSWVRLTMSRDLGAPGVV